jgi:hypothetical protein
MTTARAWALRICLGLLLASNARAQDAALRDRVQQLVGRLQSGSADEQAAAESALVALGARALPVLPEPDTLPNAAARERLARVRSAIEEAAQAHSGEASHVTIQGQGIRLSEALQTLQKQSGNRVTDLREQNGQPADNPAINLDLKDATFFEALDTMARLAGLTPYFYTDDGSIGLMAAGGMDSTDNNNTNNGADTAKPDPRVAFSGPVRVELQEIVVKREFGTGRSAANARLDLAWEPRLRPMLLTLNAAAVTVTDDQGRTVPPSLEGETTSIPLNAASPIAEINLNMAAPERSARSLASLKVEARMTLPAGVRTFRFADLSHPEDRQMGQVSVSLVSTTVEDFQWKVRVLVGIPGQSESLDSYQQSLMNNRLWLQKADGSRFEHNGGYSDLGASDGKVGFEYVFVDAPGKPSDYSLVYETPSEVATVPVTFEFKDVPLP